MAFELNTDLSTVKPNDPGGSMFPISDKMGWLCHIVDSEVRETTNKQGMRAVFKLEGIDGPVAGMTMEYGVNVVNSNPKAVEIGMAEISAIGHCVGVLRVGSSAMLHNKPFRVIIRQQRDDATRVEVGGVLDVNGNPPSKAGQGPIQPQTAPQQGGGFQPQATQPQGGGFQPQGNQPVQGFQPGGQAPAGNGWTPPANQGPGIMDQGAGAPAGFDQSHAPAGFQGGGQPQGQGGQGPAGGFQPPAGGQQQQQPAPAAQGWQPGPAQGQPAQGGQPAWANTAGR